MKLKIEANKKGRFLVSMLKGGSVVRLVEGMVF